MPALQGVQTEEDVAPTAREKAPELQSCGLPSPAVGQKLPAGHGVHVLLLEAPTKRDDVPLGQQSSTLAAALQLEPPQAV